MKTDKALLLMGLMMTLTSSATEWIKNGDFENGTTAPWYFSTPSKHASLSIIADSELPGGGSGALGITFDKDRRTSLRQAVNVGPGKYKFSAYIDTTRCPKQNGYVTIQVTGTVGGKWNCFASVATPDNRSNTKKITKWQKYEKIFTVPEDGKIKSIFIMLSLPPAAEIQIS